LLGLVHERRAGIVFGRPPRPRGSKFLVGPAPQEDGLGCTHEGTDSLTHLRVEGIVERPRRPLDNAIKCDELMHCDLAHGDLLRSRCLNATTCSRRPARSEEIIAAADQPSICKPQPGASGPRLWQL